MEEKERTGMAPEAEIEGENEQKGNDKQGGSAEQESCCCGCRHKYRAPQEERDLIHRLNRIEGQIRGVRAMVQDDRYCTDILVQVSAIQAALNGFSKTLLSSHIRSCVVEDIKNGREKEAISELCETIKKMM